MDTQYPVLDPFALMLNPEAVIQAMERSDRLARLQRRICRPLDKPLIAHRPEEVEAFDNAVDRQGEADEA